MTNGDMHGDGRGGVPVEGLGVVYVPTLLRSLAEIKKAFGVGERQVKQWAAQGAPVAVEGEGPKTRYSAEMARLQLWREARCAGRKV